MCAQGGWPVTSTSSPPLLGSSLGTYLKQAAKEPRSGKHGADACTPVDDKAVALGDAAARHGAHATLQVAPCQG